MYTNVSKRKNDKIKGRKKKKLGAAEHQPLVPCNIIDEAYLRKGTKMGCEYHSRPQRTFKINFTCILKHSTVWGGKDF
jgi:hypothetical protein